jgi:hypothetical protein
LIERPDWLMGRSVGRHHSGYEHEILIALQPLLGFDTEWDALASQVKKAPSTWRWWVRRHPASSGPYRGVRFTQSHQFHRGAICAWGHPAQYRNWLCDGGDEQYQRLLSLRLPRVVVVPKEIVDEEFSLQRMLPHMTVAVSRTSKSASEAAAFGIPALFLAEPNIYDEGLRALINQRRARVVDVLSLNAEIARLPTEPYRSAAVRVGGVNRNGRG